MTEQASKTRARAAVLLRAAMEALDESGGSLPLRDVKAAVARKVRLDAYDLYQYEKTGYVRWESILHFYSIDATKAGFIRKSDGKWHLTDEGRAALRLPGMQLLDEAQRRYRVWKAGQSPTATDSDEPARSASAQMDTATELGERAFVLERAEAEARAEIESHVRSMGPYEFQELVAALLRGMGYATPVIASRGPDEAQISSHTPIRSAHRRRMSGSRSNTGRIRRPDGKISQPCAAYSARASRSAFSCRLEDSRHRPSLRRATSASISS